MSKIISRQDAKSGGSKHFFTGEPCPRSHIAKRFVSNGQCFVCASDIRKANQKANAACVARWRESNRDRRNESARRWYAENIEVSRRRTRDWQKRNPDKVLANKEKWKAENADRIRETGTAWRLNNPDKVRATQNRRWATEQGAEGSFSCDDLTAAMERQEGRCVAPHCLTDINGKYSIDHIIPLSRGGTNWPHNIQLLCSTCNSSKRDRTMEEWLVSLARRGVWPLEIAA